MRKFSLGVIFGLIVGLMLSFTIATASPAIKLIINGEEIKTDTPPQMINGRVMVPARFVAEPLGATVEFKDNAVMITSKQETGGSSMNGNTATGTAIKLFNPLITHNNEQYVTMRPVFEYLASKYNDPNASFYIDGTLTINGVSHQLKQALTPEQAPVYSLDDLVKHGLLESYSFDEAKSELYVD